MRKYQKAAVIVAMLSSVSFLGAGVGHAADGDAKVKIDNKQNQSCEQNEKKQGLINIDDINVNLAILGIANQDNSERESLTCTQLNDIK
ncbi:hypothetical protein E0500_002000 [Streptomyces sp. KM273126]|uniref:hypothetical protein n=1 Tax=Streptomyces sp. KM273126 TaxID=2545247 RepID=UPI00103A0994|nr:hypothetical protein [Streptomyces sp. KM273126]MBA2806264.1 hypothetical protein [Streptomyces sp. KM273126]